MNTRGITSMLNFTENPIARAEFRHQRHVIRTSRSGRGWILLALLMLAPALATSLVLVGMGLAGLRIDPIIYFRGDLYSQLFRLGIVALITMNIALYVVVTLVTLGLSAASITRERAHKTWDVLLLTNVDARQMVLGKWWASLRALWGDHLLVGLLRLGLVEWVMADLYRFGDLPVSRIHVLVLMLAVLIFTAIDAAFSAALGVAVPLSELPGAVTGPLVIGVRVVASAAAVWLFIVIRRSLLASGPYLAITLAGLVGFALVTWLVLRVAQFIAVRGLVSPPDTTAEVAATG